ncbi:MAG: DUF1444 family protein [Acidiferrobacteraceae bacterium]
MHNLGNGLVVAYVVDKGQSFAYVQNSHLTEAVLDPVQLHEYGLGNLRQLAKDKLKVQKYGPVYAAFLDGNFEASLILLDGLWSHGLADLVRGDFVVAIPARDILAFCDISSSEGLAELRKVVARVADSDHSLSPSLYRRRDSEWVPYVV